MPQTKLTPRKEHKCPMCKFKSFDMVEITRHITDCGLKQMEKKYFCAQSNCSFSTNKLGNLNRHKKRHADLEQQNVTTSVSNATKKDNGTEVRVTESTSPSEKPVESRDTVENKKL